MGACKFCGRPAGFLRREHPDCLGRHARGRSEIQRLTIEAVRSDLDLSEVDQQVENLAAETMVADGEIYLLRLGIWQKLADEFISTGCTDCALQTVLTTLSARYRLATKDRNSKGHVTKISHSRVLLTLDQGKLPTWPFQINVPINLLKGEQVVWVISQVTLLEDRRHRSYSGSYGGPSVRVVRGVYMHGGAFRGEPVTTTDRVRVGTGSLVATDQHIYFAGGTKSYRVPFNKIVAFLPFTNGVGIVRDGVNAKIQIFVTGDDFAFNLLHRLASFEPSASSASEDPMYNRAVQIVLETCRGSVSGVQRLLHIDYSRAASLIEQMEKNGIVSAPDEKGARTVLRMQ